MMTAGSIGDNLGFDFTTFLNEIPRLKLANQQMTINIQTVDKASIVSEKGIGLGLSSCKREGIVPSPTSVTPSPEFYHFYDQACVWSHLHPYDEKNVLENKFKVNKKLSLRTQHVVRFIILLALRTVADFNAISLKNF